VHVPDEARDAREAGEPELVAIETPPEKAAGLEEEAAEQARVAEVRVQRRDRAEARSQQHRWAFGRSMPQGGRHEVRREGVRVARGRGVRLVAVARRR